LIAITRTAAPAYLSSPDAHEWAVRLCARRAQYYADLGAFHRRERTEKPRRPHANSDHYGHADVRAALEMLFGSKCAYCETEVQASGPQHIEHYRPAAIYPALAYRWDNLLLACPHCNVTYKRDRFPIRPTGNTPKEHRRTPGSRDDTDDPLLLNPCRDDPTVHLTFDAGIVIALTDRGRCTRRICGLNRASTVTGFCATAGKPSRICASCSTATEWRPRAASNRNEQSTPRNYASPARTMRNMRAWSAPNSPAKA
jgi:uncharacterized protein (TIGR02646 family)